MATLNFNGKSIIWNHHLSIPYHTLEKDDKLSYNPEKANGNLLIEGDNLLALKSLLPKYTGKIKCIYIDPPYNTGNEGWVYNDNVNSPRIKEWLNKEVGKDDLARHDKWLCMMTPRLRMLRELLSDDGVIFISIDDNEIHHLLDLMDELFLESNHVATIIWEKRYTRSNNAKLFASSKEYILLYRKTELVDALKESRSDKSNSIYSNPDNDPRGDWTSVSYVNPATKDQRPNLVYPIRNPTNNYIVWHPTNAWKYSKDTYEIHLKENRLLWGTNGSNKYPRLKKFLSEVSQGIVPTDIWYRTECGTTDEGTKELEELMREKVFDNPKPTKLIRRIIALATDENDIILDSFAGSGTTAHAVMVQNEADGKDRRFILVQMAEAAEKDPNKNICRDITRERIKRVIEKRLTNKDIGFEYLKVGIPIDSETILNGQLPSYSELAKYVYYLATGEVPSDKVKIEEARYFIGSFGDKSLYLIYKQDFEALKTLALDLDFAEKIYKENPKGEKIVYAPSCFLDDEHLEDFNIKFVSIPYNLFERE